MPGDRPVSKAVEQEIQSLHQHVRQKLSEIEQVYQHSPVGLVLMDKEYRFVRINERMAEINGLRVEAHIGRTLREVLPDLAPSITELYRPVYERGEPVLNVEIQGQSPTDPNLHRHWLANFFPFHSETGEVVGLIGAVVDITELKAKEASLRESEERFRIIFEAVTDSILLHDIEIGRFVDVNQRAVNMFGYTKEELLTKSIEDLWDNKPDTQSTIDLALAGNSEMFERRCKKKDRTLFWAEICCRDAIFGCRKFTLCTLRDINLRRDTENKLIKMARFDTLTGLANRGVFVTNTERAIAEARRGGAGVAVLYIDLDHFKDVNDTLGHPTGDGLLKLVAQRLHLIARASDTVARFGGDEFAVLMPDLLEPADAGTLANKIVDAMELPFLIDTNEVHVGASIGIALYESETDAEALLSHADVALYRSKSEGRHTYRFFNDAMDHEVRGRVKLVTELREAIAKEHFFIVYQPQVNLKSGCIIGVEALVRWRHPTKGILMPGLFISTAERSGLIVPLGKWILSEACSQARRWLDEGVSFGRVAVNLSSLQFRSPGELEKEIDFILVETRLPAHMLEIELTESTVMEANRDQSSILEGLRERGISIAIDDFGTGYSSLAYLRRFRIDRIKLAQEFMVDLATDPNDAAIVHAAIGLARDLGIDVIAEGVETEAQLELLKSWECGAAQGFYFSKPMLAKNVTRLLRARILQPPSVRKAVAK